MVCLAGWRLDTDNLFAPVMISPVLPRIRVVEAIYLPSNDVHLAEQIRNGPLVEGKGTYS